MIDCDRLDWDLMYAKSSDVNYSSPRWSDCDPTVVGVADRKDSTRAQSSKCTIV